MSTPSIRTPFAAAGSQRWLQVAVTNAPKLLCEAFRQARAIEPDDSIEWISPLRADGFHEYRDGAALEKLGIRELPRRRLSSFWPNRGPVWDGLGRSRRGRALLVEAKAHIPEAATPASQAKGDSLLRIQRALQEARRYYAPKSTADWSARLYQYTNRLAFQYFLSHVNQLDSRVMFLYFYNAVEMAGPASIEEWKGAIRLIHAMLGLPEDLTRFGIHEAYIDVRDLKQTL